MSDRVVKRTNYRFDDLAFIFPYDETQCQVGKQSQRRPLRDLSPAREFQAHEDTAELQQVYLSSNTKRKSQGSPRETVFEQCAFELTCRRLQKKNEAGVIRIIGELIVPSAESAINLSHVTFPHLVVSVNEGWDSSISLDEDQQLPPLAQLHFFHNLDNFDYLGHSLIMWLGFPDNASLRINWKNLRLIDGNKTTYYRHPIHEFSFAALNGKEKWTSYKFVMGVYDDWAPSHFKRLCSAINGLPEINPDVSQQPEILPQPEPGFSESTGLSQGIEGVNVQDSSFTSVLEEEAQPSPSDSQVPPSRPPRENEGKSSEAFKLPQKRRK
uniref:DUF7924 domain-containing protein n=1 Tax=Coccidioides posadasii RMSCC 3488 TaxID=454284 RepID=A0A0J6FPS8_COCPO|nr:hypothetical protein CPAG_07772 [Coccidioides posadasii RMSCC 3488]